MQTFKVGLVLLVLAVPLSLVHADLIVVDGALADWSQPNVITGEDPNDFASGIAPEYDIHYTRSLWDTSANKVFFDCETFAPLPPNVGGNVVELMIDSDDDDATGGGWNGVSTGLEYLVRFDLSTTAPLTYGGQIGLGDNYGFYSWNGVNWQLSPTAPAGLAVSRGTALGGNGVEWALAESAIGNPGTFAWTVHLDDNAGAPDDQVDMQKAVPEPATLALFALGLGGLYLKRRRNES